jgi:phosphohistidine phosphatase SixA
MKRFFIAIIFCLSTSLTASSAFASELAIWDRLQGSAPKGYVLLLRHALAPGVGDPDNFKIDDCSTQRNLSAQGREDAKAIGQWIKRREIKIAQVQSSRWCRAKESAQLLNLGKVNLNKNLDSLFQEADAVNHIQTKLVRKQIQDYRQKSGLLILVGHFVNISALTGASVDSGEGVLVRADSKGKIVVVGRSPKP